MAFRESETVELKRIVVDDIKSDIVAFANCDGGKLYIGIEDDGTVIGLNDADQSALQISNMIRLSLKTDMNLPARYCASFRKYMNILINTIRS